MVMMDRLQAWEDLDENQFPDRDSVTEAFDQVCVTDPVVANVVSRCVAAGQHDQVIQLRLMVVALSDQVRTLQRELVESL